MPFDWRRTRRMMRAIHARQADDAGRGGDDTLPRTNVSISLAPRSVIDEDKARKIYYKARY